MKSLTTSEVAARLKRYGPNTLIIQKRVPLALQFLSRFKNPLVIILLLAATLSAFLGDAVSFVIITTIVLLSVVLDFVNSYKSQKAADALKERVRVLAEVLRSGIWQRVPLTHLVPGDTVRLEVGNMIPADGKVMEGKDLYINESALTGESYPQAKTTGDPLYLGSSITTGTAIMQVTATGKSTKFSHIAQALEQKEIPTEFDQEIRDFSLLIVRITFFLVIIIFALNAIFKHDVLQSLLFSLALAVGLTPELLPLIITLNLTKGSLSMAKHGVIVKKLSAIQNFGSMDVLCTDKTGTLTEDKIVLVRYVNGTGQEDETVLLNGYIISLLSSGFENPLDRAVKAFRHIDSSGYKKIDEIPFDFERKRESVVVKHQNHYSLLSKGAPETVLQVCATYQQKPLDVSLRNRINAQFEELSNDGFRVLAIASRQVHKKKAYEPVDETNMDFQGFIAFLDPAKKSVTDTLQRINAYGVEVKIITGDNLLVSQKIAGDIKLSVKGVATGAEIDALDDMALAQLVEHTTIFARVAPEQKMRLIRVLQHNGHVVGYMGDGINDAPAIKTADIGISVNNAVDVAKESADIILLHKSLSELIEGVIEGRRTFANTLKYLMMSLSSNFGNMFSMAGASVFLPFLPMTATQILFNNLLYDGSQFAIPLDNVDEEALKKPHTLSIKGVKEFMWVFGPLSSIFDFTTFGLMLLVFQLGEHQFQTAWFLESMLTQILVVFIIRTKKIPFVQSWPSWPLLASTLVVLAVACMAALSTVGSFFGFQRLGVGSIVTLGLIVAGYLLSAEIVKRVFYRQFSNMSSEKQ